MRRTTLREGGFAKHVKQTRKEKFLLRMARIIPWDELSKAIEPRYPKLEGSGRLSARVGRMLRIHLMRHWLDLSGLGMEDALSRCAPKARDDPKAGAGHRKSSGEERRRNRNKSKARRKAEQVFL
ncbi:hypothetical protein [Candidatus Spongiihabitans sp.]|uniref:hypothetical protein n=1 Tax=Candidatus Spongiihabitans sp. TaxID=3101308 RepID=UPI003C700E51